MEPIGKSIISLETHSSFRNAVLMCVSVERNPVYTVIWNILDYTATVIPVSKVDPVLDPKQSRDSFYSDMDRQIWETCELVTLLENSFFL